MKTIKLKKSIIKELDDPNNDYNVEFQLYGFPAFAVKSEYGEYQTPNGTRFDICFYNPNPYTLKVEF